MFRGIDECKMNNLYNLPVLRVLHFKRVNHSSYYILKVLLYTFVDVVQSH